MRRGGRKKELETNPVVVLRDVTNGKPPCASSNGLLIPYAESYANGFIHKNCYCRRTATAVILPNIFILFTCVCACLELGRDGRGRFFNKSLQIKRGAQPQHTHARAISSTSIAFFFLYHYSF